MIIVETPVKTIEQEIVDLYQTEGPNARVYARGAIDALNWILHGTTRPSEGGSFPVLIEWEQTSAH